MSNDAQLAEPVYRESPTTASLRRDISDTDAVKMLKPVHRKIIALSAAGLKNKEIAAMLDISEPWVSQVLTGGEAQAIRNQLVDEFVAGLHGDTRDMINAYTYEAVGTVVGLMRNAKDNIRLAAAKDILDRGGFKPMERVQVQNINLSSGDAADIKAALLESLEEVPLLKEAEVTAAAFTKLPSNG
jgi:predicted transcriptional regulator